MDRELQKLLLGCKAGDEDKWSLLFAKYYPTARRLVRNKLRTLDAQSVDLLAQDAMLALHGKIQNINNADHLVNFLRCTVRNKCVDYIRRNKLILMPISDDFPMIEETSLLTDDIKEAISKAMGNLNEQAASILNLRYFEAMSYREIAIKLNIEETQVGMKLSRALKNMKRELAKLGVASMHGMRNSE